MDQIRFHRRLNWDANDGGEIDRLLLGFEDSPSVRAGRWAQRAAKRRSRWLVN